MSSKAQRRKARRQRAKVTLKATMAPDAPHSAPARQTARPTAERMARGVWANPQGQDKGRQPMVDVASDMIGELLVAKRITTSQEQAARLFQRLRAAYLVEIGAPHLGSCLSGGNGGYDAGDGSPETIKAYRDIENRIGRIKTACLILETEKLSGDRPNDLGVLRLSLDCMNGS